MDCLAADYVTDRKAAMELVKSNKLDEALVVLTNMAAGAGTSEFQKSDAMEQAALCANRLKRYDQSLDLAARIPMKPIAKKCRMGLMFENRKFKELIEEFKTEDIEKWPGQENTVGEGFYYRGMSYFQWNDGTNAVKDLRKSAEYLADEAILGQACLRLGDANLKLNNEPQALEAYLKAIKAANAGGWIKSTASVSAAGILRKQGKFDEAFRILENAGAGKIEGYWGFVMLCSWADTLSAQGKKADAVAKYKEALALKGINEAQKKEAEKVLQSLSADVK
jgi:tetratricopeptide (TPR) repeat protein